MCYVNFIYIIIIILSVRFGPRSCVSVPDISAISLPTDRHSRFVLASDGVWDVMDEEDLCSIILYVQNTNKAARLIAEKAFELRMEHNCRMDDITVVVVDVNRDMFVPPHATSHLCNCSIS